MIVVVVAVVQNLGFKPIYPSIYPTNAIQLSQPTGRFALGHPLNSEQVNGVARSISWRAACLVGFGSLSSGLCREWKQVKCKQLHRLLYEASLYVCVWILVKLFAQTVRLLVGEIRALSVSQCQSWPFSTSKLAATTASFVVVVVAATMQAIISCERAQCSPSLHERAQTNFCWTQCGNR